MIICSNYWLPDQRINKIPFITTRITFHFLRYSAVPELKHKSGPQRNEGSRELGQIKSRKRYAVEMKMDKDTEYMNPEMTENLENCNSY